MSSKKTSGQPASPTRQKRAPQPVQSPVAESPSFWIIGGANGSGKTTSYTAARLTEAAGSVWIINPDALAARIVVTEGLAPEAANLQAVVRIEAWLDASISAHQTVGVETVMSTAKYRRIVERARGLGFRTRLVYVVLRDADLNVARVAARVAKGGHDVPEDKIRSRRTRSFEQLSWFFNAVDRADIFDNSGASPLLLVTKEGDEVTIHGPLFDELANALRPAIPNLGALLSRAN
jgi:predicted ABC-type ATPase